MRTILKQLALALAVLLVACCAPVGVAPAYATDLSVTPASVQPASDTTKASGIAGATITAGQALYIDTADSNKLKLADANAASSVTRTLAGIALHGASSGQPIQYATGGGINPGGTVTVGTIYVLSATAGGIAPAGDLAQGWYTSIIGIGTTSSNIQLFIKNGGVAVP